MSLMNCRGESAKKQIVAEYDLKPVVYIRLLNGQKIEGCCGSIKDKYYLFESKHKATEKIENFCVGYDCADQFLELINHPPLQLFNPFQSEQSGASVLSVGRDNERQKKITMAPLNKELKDAIHILCSAWGGKAPKGRLRAFLEFIQNNPGKPTKAFAVVDFNRIVGKDAKNRTLTRIIDDLRLKNPKLRVFHFPLMDSLLTNEGHESNL